MIGTSEHERGKKRMHGYDSKTKGTVKHKQANKRRCIKISGVKINFLNNQAHMLQSF